VKRPWNSGGQQHIVESVLDAMRPGWRERLAKRKSTARADRGGDVDESGIGSEHRLARIQWGARKREFT
jgi:hypothetical protein